MKILVKKPKFNPIAKDLRTLKYKMRVEIRRNTYNRKLKHKKGQDAILV